MLSYKEKGILSVILILPDETTTAHGVLIGGSRKCSETNFNGIGGFE